MHTSTVLFSSG